MKIRVEDTSPTTMMYLFELGASTWMRCERASNSVSLGINFVVLMSGTTPCVKASTGASKARYLRNILDPISSAIRPPALSNAFSYT